MCVFYSSTQEKQHTSQFTSHKNTINWFQVNNKQLIRPKPTTAATTSTSTMAGSPYFSGLSPSSSGSSRPAALPQSFSSSPPSVIHGPCAACKMLRRRCAEKCVLAPYFPRTEPLKFAIAHKVFGASNIIKMLQELPEGQRVDAVNSMVYEANARIQDPVYGCTGTICLLQKQISDLQVEVAKARAEIFNMQCQNDNLLSLISMGLTSQHPEVVSELHPSDNTSWFLHDRNPCAGNNYTSR